MKALWFLLALASLFGLTACLEDEPDGVSQDDYEYLEEEVRVLKEDLEKAYLELDDYDVKFEAFEELEMKAGEAEQNATELEEMQKEKEGVEEKMRELRKEFDDYQKKYEAKVRKAAEGEEFATLEVAEKTLKDVVISSVSETTVKLRHADGFATLNSTTAPAEWTKRFFLRSDDEIAERAAQLAAFLNPSAEEEAEAEEPGRPLSEYQLSRLERRAEEVALEAIGPKVDSAIVSISGKNASGTGFFAQDGITTYLYTNAKFFDNNPGLSITDMNGREWKKFGELEVSPDQDLVRMAVTEPVENALKLHSVGEVVQEGSYLKVLSLAKGSQKPEHTRLQMRGIRQGVYDLSSGDLKDFVGGALINSEGEVLAIITRPLVQRRDVFEDKEKAYDRVRPVAYRLDQEQEWVKTSLASFLSSSKKLAAFDQTSLYLYALGLLKPNEKGVDLERRISGGETVGKVLEASNNPQDLERIKRINKDLSDGRNLSQRDINRKFQLIFRGAYGKARNEALDEKDFSPFFHSEVQLSSQFRRKALAELEEILEAVR